MSKKPARVLPKHVQVLATIHPADNKKIMAAERNLNFVKRQAQRSVQAAQDKLTQVLADLGDAYDLPPTASFDSDYGLVVRHFDKDDPLVNVPTELRQFDEALGGSQFSSTPE